MRVIFFSGVLMAGYLLPFWIFLMFAFFYALQFHAYELIIVGVLIDSQFGLGGLLTSSAYSLSLTSLVFIIELVKPHISFHKKQNAFF